MGMSRVHVHIQNGLLLCFIILFESMLSLEAVEMRGFQYMEEVQLECRNERTKEWGGAPVCIETGKPLSFSYGVDTFLYCSLLVKSQEDYDDVVDRLNLKTALNCRVPIDADRRFFVPMSIPVWGVVEDDHFHIDTHMNFAFHVGDGKIMGAAGYPVRDDFQFTKVGMPITFHGPVRWFNRHSFNGLTSHSAADVPVLQKGVSYFSVACWCAISCLVVIVAGIVGYQKWLKPSLLKLYLTKEE